jgi:hypothetical protein
VSGVSTNQFYWAFISYSSKDRKWGEWLHKRLEHYPIPSEFQGIELFDGAVLGKNLRPVFRDRDELSGSSDLGPAIRKALDSTRFLIVLCSKNSAKSAWVNKEVADFKAMGKERNILALILDGEPNASSRGKADEECFPPELRYPAEPLAGDLRKEGDGKERGLLKIVAGIAQLDFDKLYRRHERAQARKRLVAGFTAALMVIVFAGLSFVAITQRGLATQEKNRAERQLYAASISAADQFLKSGNTKDAVLNLAKSPEALRSWEWHFLAQHARFAPFKVESDKVELFKQPAFSGSGLYEAAKKMLKGADSSTAEDSAIRRSRDKVEVIVTPKLSYNTENYLEVRVRGELKTTLESSRFSDIVDVWISEDESTLLILGERIRGSYQLLEMAESSEGSAKKQAASEDQAISGMSFYLLPIDCDAVLKKGDRLKLDQGVPARSADPVKEYEQSLPLTEDLHWSHTLSYNAIRLDGEANTGEKLALEDLGIDPYEVMTDIHQPIEWGRSPGNTYFWIHSYDSSSQSDEFRLRNVSTGELVLYRSEQAPAEAGSGVALTIPLVRDIDFNEDESLLAFLDRDSLTVLLFDFKENRIIKRLPYAEGQYDHNTIDLIQEFEGVDDRIIVGGWLLRRSSLLPILNVGNYAFSRDGDMAISIEQLSGDSVDPDSPAGEGYWVEVTSGIRSSAPSRLSDRIRQYQMEQMKSEAEREMEPNED